MSLFKKYLLASIALFSFSAAAEKEWYLEVDVGMASMDVDLSSQGDTEEKPLYYGFAIGRYYPVKPNILLGPEIALSFGPTASATKTLGGETINEVEINNSSFDLFASSRFKVNDNIFVLAKVGPSFGIGTAKQPTDPNSPGGQEKDIGYVVPKIYLGGQYLFTTKYTYFEDQSTFGVNAFLSYTFGAAASNEAELKEWDDGTKDTIKQPAVLAYGLGATYYF